MFKWLRRLMGKDPVVHNVNIHITGELKLNYEGGPGYKMVPSQGPLDTHAPTETGDGMGGGSKPAEPDIRPEFFADTGTPEVNFGIDSEEPPKRTSDKNH